MALSGTHHKLGCGVHYPHTPSGGREKDFKAPQKEQQPLPVGQSDNQPNSWASKGVKIVLAVSNTAGTHSGTNSKPERHQRETATATRH